ncbi:MAG: glycosyltransferase family 2 protein [Lachnospiraceae bacterium]|nr:glycosyltransferase family 2 protein [Lachnospiraceae bacterium]MEE0920553.1 glycosyltransferase family 2 protein [Lachnospiraceae bacterium]
METYTKTLSIIVPCYNEEESIPLFYNETIKQEEFFHQKSVEFEFIFVNDGSKDGTVDAVKKLHEKDKRVHLVSFSRNFGKEAAIIAGLEKSTGDFTVLMDADLQDPPAILPEMYGYIEQGYDSVATRRVDRKGEPPIRSFFARRFYSLMRKISKTEIVDGARDYRLMTRQVTDAILSMKEYNRFSKGIFGWVGYNTKWLEYENVQRAAGETKWSFWKLFLYSLDGIMAFSTFPLSVAAFFGIFFCLVAFAFMLFIFIRALIYGDPVAGWPSIICVVTFIGGVQLLCTGIIGEYMSKMYMEVKDRPKYLVKDEF